MDSQHDSGISHPPKGFSILQSDDADSTDIDDAPQSMSSKESMINRKSKVIGLRKAYNDWDSDTIPKQLTRELSSLKIGPSPKAHGMLKPRPQDIRQARSQSPSPSLTRVVNQRKESHVPHAINSKCSPVSAISTDEVTIQRINLCDLDLLIAIVDEFKDIEMYTGGPLGWGLPSERVVENKIVKPLPKGGWLVVATAHSLKTKD